MNSKAKAVLVGMAISLGLTALGLDTSVSLSTYGLYLGASGPFLVIAGIPVFLNLIIAYVLVRPDQKLMRYTMIITAVVASSILGYLAFRGIFHDLLGSG